MELSNSCGAAAFTIVILADFVPYYRRNLWRPCTIVILAQFFLAPAARLPVLSFFWLISFLLRRNLWSSCIIVILAQFLLAPEAPLSYNVILAFFLLTPEVRHVMALYYFVFG